ncbi:unnamed protein product [Sphagnum jensenii]|uniref:G-patch domain-containing protein n=1 Tax=Sphagnum jensenii TaxID=128206 RepID=A0ABP0VII3_9BRYO
MEGEESAAAVPDPGFVLDAASGLYYHASSGFYYDAKAGWYYSTRDGLYYTFENDGYVPLASSSSSMSITVAEDDNNKNNTAVPEANWQSLGEDNKDNIEVQVAAVSSTTEEEETRPASVWIQEALVELYLQNYPNSEVGTSGSAEAFMDSSSLSYDVYNVQSAGIEGDDGSEELEEGEWRPEEATDGQRESALEVGISVEEQWHAHYSRVPRPGVRVRLYPGSIELWDWTTVEQEQKTAKKKKARKLSVRLVGRLAPNSNNLHPSLGGSGGFIRTSPISEVDHEFVKVSSGRIYKLRRPSSKHLATITNYDSLNPTCDWGFPQINTTFADGETDVTEAEDRSASASDTTKPSGDTRKQRYRDRAAERRTLHRGFGTGPGQKGMPVHEMEKLEAETATEMPTALAKAAKARPLGCDNIGKRMLQGMGWKEGQSLGPGEGGLINPIQALGNTGRSGLGWS